MRTSLAAEAIVECLARELATLEGIKQGRDDIRAGRFSSHAEVANETKAIVEAARPK